MSHIRRLVEINENSFDIREGFIDFIHLEMKTVEGNTEAIRAQHTIQSKRKRYGLNLSVCRC